MTFKPGDIVRLAPHLRETRNYPMRVVGTAESGWVVCEYGDEAFDSFDPAALVHDPSNASERARQVVMDYFWGGKPESGMEDDLMAFPGPKKLTEAITRAIEEAVDEARQEAV